MVKEIISKKCLLRLCLVLKKFKGKCERKKIDKKKKVKGKR